MVFGELPLPLPVSYRKSANAYISSIVSYKMLAELPSPSAWCKFYSLCRNLQSPSHWSAFTRDAHSTQLPGVRVRACPGLGMGSHSNTKKACARSCAQTCCIRNTFFEEGALCLRVAACPKVHSAQTRGARLDRARFLLIFLVSRTRTLCFDVPALTMAGHPW